jgi:hypothetical protein
MSDCTWHGMHNFQERDDNYNKMSTTKEAYTALEKVLWGAVIVLR